MCETTEVTLDARTEELEARETTFGAEEVPAGGIAGGGFVALIGNRPIGFRATRLLQQLGTPIPPALTLFKRFDVFLVPHRLSVVRRAGWSEPTAVGIEVKYKSEGETCSVISLFPSFEFIRHGSVGLEASGAIGVGGDLGGLKNRIESEQQVTLGGLTVRGLAAEGDLRASVGLSLRATVATPRVMAVGIGSDRCEWRMDRAEEPLLGHDIETWAGVVLNKRTDRIRYRARAYMTTRIVFVPTRRESQWVDVECVIENS